MRDPAELLAAYVDGISELTPDERRAVEALIAGDPGLRADAAATRELIGSLRDLGPGGNEPDWSAMERAIGEAVGPTVPRPWWRARVWRWLAPALGTVAATAAILLLVTRTDPSSAVDPIHPREVIAPTAGTQVQPSEESVALWLDGADVEVGMAAEDLLGPEDLEDDDVVTNGILPTTDLAWIDGLDDESLDLAEHALEPRKKG